MSHASFPPSLHALSVAEGVVASAKRTPGKVAVVDGQGVLTYGELLREMQACAAASPSPRPAPPEGHRLRAAPRAALVDLLAAALHGTSEDDPVATVRDSAGAPLALSHRTLVLRLLNAAVMHAAFSRDTVSATTLPLTTAAGLVAALAPLWLGGTLHIVEDPAALPGRITHGTVNQAWIEGAWIDRLALVIAAAPPPPDSFRLAILMGRPADAAWSTWANWLGESRVVIEHHDPHLGALTRARGGRDRTVEPHIGVMTHIDGDGSAHVSGLATAPATPAWRPLPDAQA